MARKKRWIKKAIRRPGAFTRKARRAGRSVATHARAVIRRGAKRAGLRTFRQAVLARTLSRLPRRGRRSARTKARRR